MKGTLPHCFESSGKVQALRKEFLYIIQWSDKSACRYRANILWYVLMNYRPFDLKELDSSLASLEWAAVRDAVESFPLDLISIVITRQKKH